MIKKIVQPAVLAGSFALFGFVSASAQDNSEDDKKWSVGLLGIANRTPFNAVDASGDEEEDVLYNAFPYITYNGNRFFATGLGVGYRLVKPDDTAPIQFGVDIIAAARNVMVPGRNKVTADAGLAVNVGGTHGTLSVSGVHDATDTFNGGELSATYSYTFSSGNFSFTPSISANWQDKDTANHMWGVSEAQRARALEKGRNILPVFELKDSVVNYNAQSVVTYAVTEDWTVIGYGGVSLLDKKIRKNPGIGRKYEATLGLGVVYNF